MSGVFDWFRNNSAPPKIEPTPVPRSPTPTKPIPKPTPVSVKGKGLLYYPGAIVPKKSMSTKGEYAGGYPLGAVVHHSAGSDDGIYEYGLEQSYTYFVINRDGSIIQGFPINKWGYHAGESKWLGLGTSVSTKLVGIEVVSAGKLEKTNTGWKSWFGKSYSEDQVRQIPENRDNIQEGDYHKFTPEQEVALVELIRWLKENDPTGQFSYDYTIGHDECSGPKGIGYWRKNDPGGSLSMTMTEFRALLKSR